MNNKDANSLLYGIGVIDFFNKNLIIKNDKIENYLNKFEELLDFGNNDKDYYLKLLQIDSSNLIFNNYSKVYPTKEQKQYLKRIKLKNSKNSFALEFNNIRKSVSTFNSKSNIEEVRDIIFKISCFPFCYLINEDLSVFNNVRLSEDVFYYLNYILKIFPSLYKEVSAIKANFYPLYYLYILKNYFEDYYDENFDFVSLVMDFNKFDFQMLFNSNNRIYPTLFVGDLLEQLESDEQMEVFSGLTTDGKHQFFGDKQGDGEGQYLRFLLMTISGQFSEEYDSLFAKYGETDINNMYLNRALYFNYNKKRSKARMILKHIDKSKLSYENVVIFEDLVDLYASSKNRMKLNIDYSKKIKQLLQFDEKSELYSILNSNESPLFKFCINQIVKDILDEVRFYANDIKFLLEFSPNSVVGYLTKPVVFISEREMYELYKLSVVLLNNNMIYESWLLLGVLINQYNQEDSFDNIKFINMLKVQLSLTRYSLDKEI